MLINNSQIESPGVPIAIGIPKSAKLGQLILHGVVCSFLSDQLFQ